MEQNIHKQNKNCVRKISILSVISENSSDFFHNRDNKTRFLISFLRVIYDAENICGFFNEFL